MSRRFAAVWLIGLLIAAAPLSLAGAQPQPTPAVPPQDAADAGAAEPGSGKDLYMKRCAGCHGAVSDPVAQARAGPSRIPAKIVLETYPPAHIIEAMLYGPMVEMAIGLSETDMAKIAAYLTEKPAAAAAKP